MKQLTHLRFGMLRTATVLNQRLSALSCRRVTASCAAFAAKARPSFSSQSRFATMAVAGTGPYKATWNHSMCAHEGVMVLGDSARREIMDVQMLLMLLLGPVLVLAADAKRVRHPLTGSV